MLCSADRLHTRDMDRGVYRLDTFDPYRVDTYRIEAVLQLSVSYRTSFYDSVQKKIHTTYFDLLSAVQNNIYIYCIYKACITNVCSTDTTVAPVVRST